MQNLFMAVYLEFQMCLARHTHTHTDTHADIYIKSLDINK